MRKFGIGDKGFQRIAQWVRLGPQSVNEDTLEVVEDDEPFVEADPSQKFKGDRPPRKDVPAKQPFRDEHPFRRLPPGFEGFEEEE